MRRRWVVTALVLAVGPTACIFSSAKVREIDRPNAPVDVRTPVKAHLADGSVIVYRLGVRITPDSLIGSGVRFSLTGRDSLPVERYAMTDVVALESFSTKVNATATVLGTLLGTAATLFGAAALAVAIFGSCPTVYADAGAGLVLQAESFSYSIAPRFAVRDVDLLAVRTGADGRFTIEVRNEALETHYLDHLEMLEVRRAPDETVLPDPKGSPLALRDLVPLADARDRSGADRLSELVAADDRVFRTDSAAVDAAVSGPLDDWIDLTVPRPPGDSAAIVLRLRNSLLNTVLLYDVLLAGRGASALDWLGHDLGRVLNAAWLAYWYKARMGMHVAVREGGRWRPVGRLGDTGPIAWKDVAVVVPVPGDADSLHVRLSFAADNWRIDQVRVASRLRRPEARLLAADSITGPTGRAVGAALTAVAATDERYLITTPGERFVVHWNAGPLPPDSARTLLLAARGYYTEWVRRDWLAHATDTPNGPPSDALLRRALADWRVRQADFEQRFERTRIPVR